MSDYHISCYRGSLDFATAVESKLAENNIEWFKEAVKVGYVI